jgi:hypothetical protein
VSSRETLFLLKILKNVHMSFAATMHLAASLCLNALLTLKVEKYLIFLVGTRIPIIIIIIINP